MVSKQLIYANRKFCLHGFAVMVAGHHKAYRKYSVFNSVKQIMKECQPTNFSTFVDPHEVSSRQERRNLLVELAELEKNDFAWSSAFAFCVDHMEMLCCHDPSSGQKQLDAAVMDSMYELYTVMCGGPDSVGLVSRTGFSRALASAMSTYNFKVREHKTVSKCETCKFFFFC